MFVLKPVMAALMAISVAAVSTAKEADYMPAIRQELARLQIDSVCDDAKRVCKYEQTLSPQGPSLEISISFSEKTNTIYIIIRDFLLFKDLKEPSKELALRLLELNREMVTAKFEWDKLSGSINLSTTLSTDSNFDRRAFRSQLLGIIEVAKILWPQLSSLAVESQKKIKKKALEG